MGISAKTTIEKFRNAGYQVWMDDFGSGYSSLNILKDFEFDQIKIDESRMFCLVVCGTLIVPKDDGDRNDWSRVSLCRIDMCHLTEACTKGTDKLKERLKNCTDSYAKKDSL